MHRNSHAIMQRTLQVGSQAPVIIKAAPGAIARAAEQLGLSRISLGGIDATPEQLQALVDAPTPPEYTPAEIEQLRIDAQDDERPWVTEPTDREREDELAAFNSPAAIERRRLHAEERLKARNEPHELEMRRLYAEQERHQREEERTEDETPFGIILDSLGDEQT